MEADSIFIRNLIVMAKIGIYDAEKNQPQRIRINCFLYVRPQSYGKQDAIDKTICYAALREKMIGHLQSSHTPLLESAASDLAAICLQDPRVDRVKISIEKLDVFPDCESAGVEIIRNRLSGP